MHKDDNVPKTTNGDRKSLEQKYLSISSTSNKNHSTPTTAGGSKYANELLSNIHPDLT